MSAISRRAIMYEFKAAEALGSYRVRREKFKSTPDVEPVLAPATGLVLQPEVKSRKRAPKLIKDALAQARSYLPNAIPLAVVYEVGSDEGIACLPLSALAQLLGLRPRTDTNPSDTAQPAPLDLPAKYERRGNVLSLLLGPNAIPLR